MFRRFRCGCVAFPTPFRGLYLVVRPCDTEDDCESFFWRDLLDPGEGVPISEGEVNQIVCLISSQLRDGARFRRIRALLGLNEQPCNPGT